MGAVDGDAAWEKTRDYLQAQPGYVDTALHQAVRPGAEFEFVNVARWRSAGDFVAATQSTGFHGGGNSAAGTSGSGAELGGVAPGLDHAVLRLAFHPLSPAEHALLA